MTSGSEQGAWDQLAVALGGTARQTPPAVAAPAGWDRLRDALTGSGPSRAIGEPEFAGRSSDGSLVPGGWVQLRNALGDSGRAGEPATAVLEPPEVAKQGDVEPGPVGDRRGPLALAGRAWSTRSAKIALAVVVAAAVAAGAAVATSGGGGLPANDAFSVNGKAVSIADFNSELTVRQTLYGITPPPKSATAKYSSYLASAAQAEAVSVLLDQLAPRQGIAVSNQTAQNSLSQAISTQYGGDQTKFANALAAAGLNQDQVLVEITHNLVYQKLFAKIVGSPTVTNAQIQQYFAQHKAQLAEPETRQISHIVVATQAGAQAIVDQLKQGQSFATLAAAQSLDTATKANGGQLGLYAKADLQAPFADAAFSANLNVPFGPVQDTSGGWDVGVVTAVHPAAAATLTPVASTAIKTLLIDQAQANAWDAWLGGQIKRGHIVYAAKYRPAHPDAPPQIPIPTLTGETLAGVGPAAGTATSPSAGPASGSTPAAGGSGG